MSNVVLSETDKLKIKCAHLELTLTQERAQQTVRQAMESRDALIKGAFLSHIPDGDINAYKFDLESGIFSPNDPPQEAVEPEVMD